MAQDTADTSSALILTEQVLMDDGTNEISRDDTVELYHRFIIIIIIIIVIMIIITCRMLEN